MQVKTLIRLRVLFKKSKTNELHQLWNGTSTWYHRYMRKLWDPPHVDFTCVTLTLNFFLVKWVSNYAS